MKFGVLGPIEVHTTESAPVRLPAGRLRRLLAALLSRPGELVSVPDLIEALWANDPPRTANKALQIYIHRLRRVLGEPQRIVRHPGGYSITAWRHELDAHHLTDLIGQAGRARATGDLDLAADLLAQASALWRGKPYADILDCHFLQPEIERLTAYRTQLTEERATVGLDRGQHSELVPELAAAVADHPHRERLCALLMRALHRCGHQADALQAYRRLRARLAEDLGMDPGPELQQLHVAILRNEGTALALDPPQHVTAALRTPRQLPAAVSPFIGRAAELRQLTCLADAAATGGTVVISAIAGSGGIGKTALAVQWAHQIAPRFPDGQLYVNLRGFDPTGVPKTPAEAIREFLDAVAVPPEQIPAGLDSQAGLYRSLLSGRRILVVLDNARDANQVRPLLPGSATCLTVVTSRNRLTGLIAAEGARPITLDLLTTGQAHELLAHRIGIARVTAEPKAVADIVEDCARLPLALAVAAAIAIAQPRAGLHQLAQQLRQARGGLDALTSDDPATDLRAVFSWSYRQLTAEAARLFRLLGLHPGPDISIPAAASLAAVAPHQVRPLLTELTRAHLLVEHTPGRYTFHDLLRAYATELTHHLDPNAERQTAARRVLDHYLHTAIAADHLLNPARDPITIAAPQPGTTPEQPADREQALAWFGTERPVLLSAIHHAAGSGHDSYVWQLAWTAWTFLDHRGHWQDQATTQQAAIAAAHRQADQPAQARAHRLLAHAHTRLGRPNDAHTHVQHALELSTHAGDPAAQGHAETDLARLTARQGNLPRALDHARRALELYQSSGHRDGQANALNNMGWYHAQLGNLRQALAHCQQALTLHQELGNRRGQTYTLDSLGYVHHHLGQHTQAIACYQHALDIYREHGDRYGESDTLTRLGDTYRHQGNTDAARTAWRRALVILDDLCHADAKQVRANLDSLDDGQAHHSGT